MKFLLLFMTFILSFGYELGVNNQTDAQKLDSIGFSCNKKNNIYVCLGSNDLNELKRVQDFLNTKFNIKTQIIKNITETDTKILKHIQNNVNDKKVSYVANNISNNSFENSTQLALNTTAFPKHGYCIQVESFKGPISAKRVYQKYKSYPLARVEKIGSFYVLRVGEGNFKTIRKMASNINGLVRKCDIIPQRIIIDNFNTENISNDNQSAISAPKNITSADINPPYISNSSKLKAMYFYLNSGNLIKAKENAVDLLNIYPKDAKLVLAIVNMKNQNFAKACQILSNLHTKKAYKLRKDACYTYYLKKGFNLLPKSPKNSLSFFKRALTLKTTLSAQLGEAYSYLNSGNTKKAYTVFKKLYKKYPDNEKVIEGYANTLYALKKFDELKSLKEKLPSDLVNKLSSIDFYMKLKKAQNLMKNGEYKTAENILLDLYLQKPDDVNVLLSLGNLYLHMNQIDKAQNFYSNVLVVSPNNIYALQGLEAVCMKKEDFKNALRYSDKIISLGFNDINRKMVQKFYYLKAANFYLEKNNFDKAYEYVKKLQEIDKNDPFVLALIGDIYFKQNKKKLAYRYYAKAYSLSPDNFAISLKFLYALLNLDLYDQIKIILGKIDMNNLTPEQKEKLRKFYITLYAKYSSYLLKNRYYHKALEVVNNGLMMDVNNAELLSNKAWICMKLKNYKCANEYFKKALVSKNDDMLKYGLALSYINMGNKSKAKSILDSIQTNDKNLKIKMAGAYVQLGDIQKANLLLKNSKPRIQQIELPKKNTQYENYQNNNNNRFFPNPFLNNNSDNSVLPDVSNDEHNINNTNDNSVNNHHKIFLEDYPVKKKITLKTDASLFKEYTDIKRQIQKIEQKYISNLSAGVKLRSKSGVQGSSQLTRISLPYIKGNFFFHHKKIYFILDSVLLNSGKPNNYNQIGTPSLAVPSTTPVTSTYGLSPKIGFESGGEKYFLFQIGMTPFGSGPVSPTFTGKIKVGLNKNEKKYFISLYRKSIKDSITSYVGNKDPFTGKKWGRVIANGIKLEAEKAFDKNGSMLYANLAYENLNGKNTSSNYDISAEMLALLFSGSNLLDEDYFGFYSNIAHFNKNQDDFYFGDGGYFSPELFFSFMPRYEGYFYSKDKKFMSKAMFMMGGSYIDNWSSKKFNFAFDLGASAQYLLFNNLALESGLDYRNSKDYNDFFFTLMFKYYFGKKLYLDKNDIDNFTKKVIKW